ncbi:hypothetical protein BDV28DRAFT_132301 [Aspergillus coremiiformis]|uniref:Small ribosomal subunit protein uS11m n=1 Tax=Aspergillus coremiiformis TaxID=138285 RepID=A0A5N6Z873_9EURO|nr:hypothetical protein BDV28DRAFT_132301 [Aspergillus coremiiformis]
MTTTFASSLLKALPSLSRPCQLHLSSIRSLRPFSSTIGVASDVKDKNRAIERQILNAQPRAAADKNSAISAITKMMQGETTRTNPTVSTDYSKMAESLEAEMIKQPYSDRTPPHHLHVFSHKHNTILTLTRPNGNPLLSMSCGHLGFRKAQRSGYDPAYQLTSHVFGQMQERGYTLDIDRLEIVFRGFGQGREAFIRVLLGGEGKNIRGLVSRVTDSTRIKFGGTKSRKIRRLG